MAFAVAAEQELDDTGRTLWGRGHGPSVLRMRRPQLSATSWSACGIHNSVVHIT